MDNEKSPVKQESKRTRENRQVGWIVALMVACILLIIGIPVAMHYTNKFDYIGLEFYKTSSGGTNYFSTNVPVVDENGEIVPAPWHFRNDPRELEYIAINNIENNEIKFKKDRTVFIVLPPELPKCEENLPSVIDLTAFLDGFGLMEVKSAFNDREFAEKNNYPYVTCDISIDNTVIEIKNGSETKITRIKNNCYELQYRECEIKKVTEKFVFIILERYMELFEAGIRSEEEYTALFENNEK
jgi:hypothetical protein